MEQPRKPESSQQRPSESEPEENGNGPGERAQYESSLPFTNSRGWSNYIGRHGLIWVPEAEADARIALAGAASAMITWAAYGLALVALAVALRR